jgi:hypothetical protein
MRFRELIAEDYTDSLRSEIINLLAAVSAEGITEVTTHALLADLQQSGYNIAEPDLLSLLDQIEIVQTASADSITLVGNDDDAMVGVDADEIEQDRVDQLATAKATKDVGESSNYRRRQNKRIRP